MCGEVDVCHISMSFFEDAMIWRCGKFIYGLGMRVGSSYCLGSQAACHDVTEQPLLKDWQRYNGMVVSRTSVQNWLLVFPGIPYGKQGRESFEVELARQGMVRSHDMGHRP